MKKIKKMWFTSRGRLIIISALALVIYGGGSLIVANCFIQDYCSFSALSNNEVPPVLSEVSTTTEGSNTQAKYISYLANVFDTSIFFIVVTFAIAFFGFVKPEDEVFERKLVYLFPDLHRSEEGKKYVTQKINKMAAISPFSRHTVSFDEVISLDGGFELFKCGGIYEAQISNLHGNHSYKDDSVKITFALEQIEIDEIRKATNDIKWGQITMLRTHFEKDSDDPMPWHNGKSRNFVDKKHSYDIKELEIPAQESINIDVHFWNWSKFGKDQYDYFSVQRFTESIELFFINNLVDKRVKISYCIVKSGTEIKKLQNSEGDFEHCQTLSPSGQAGCRFRKQIKYFSPDQLVAWKVRTIEIDKKAI